MDTQDPHFQTTVIQTRLSCAKFITRLGVVDGYVNSPLITLEAKQITPVLTRRPWVGLAGYVYEHLFETSLIEI